MGEMSKTNMDRHRSYRIGLDIGIASVGWAVLENNSQDEPIRILDLGVVFLRQQRFQKQELH